ncbi:MAG: GIY-YIG nuclease family protein [Planctomycetota bacterium]
MKLIQSGGIYNLIIQLSKDKEIKIGRLGTFIFPEGFYIYTGSAQNGLERRINRHLSSSKKFHWHIDYLLSYARTIKVLKYFRGRKDECRLNRMIGKGAGASTIVRKFGSSDCNCRTHLHYFKDIPTHFPEFY